MHMKSTLIHHEGEQNGLFSVLKMRCLGSNSEPT